MIPGEINLKHLLFNPIKDPLVLERLLREDTIKKANLAIKQNVLLWDIISGILKNSDDKTVIEEVKRRIPELLE